MTDEFHPGPDRPAPRPTRSRFRLSIRGLIVLVLLIGGGLGWFEHRARVQKEAVALITKTGVTVTYDIERITNARLKSCVDWLVNAVGIDHVGTVLSVSAENGFRDSDMAAVERLSGLEELYLGTDTLGNDISITDAGLANLGRLTQLKSIDLSGTKATRAILPKLKGLIRLEVLNMPSVLATDADLADLSGLTRLRELQMQSDEGGQAGGGITDAGLASLASNPNLTKVAINAGGVTDAGLASLAKLPGLTQISLTDSRVTDAGLVHLARLVKLEILVLHGAKVTTLEPIRGLTALKHVDLSGCPITDDGLSPVAGFPGLNTLDLSRTSITDRGLIHLRGSASLIIVDLVGTKVTDAGLAQIAGMKSLVALDLSETSVSDAGVPHLLKFKRLVDLGLDGTKITDTGLLQLASRIVTIRVLRTAVTPEGIAAAKLAGKPGFEIYADPPKGKTP